MSVWIKKTRPIGRLHLSINHSILNDIRKIIPTEDDDGDFNSWTHVALEKLTWSMLVNSLGYNNNFNTKNISLLLLLHRKKILHLQILHHLLILHYLQFFHHLLIKINLLKVSLLPLQKNHLIHLPGI